MPFSRLRVDLVSAWLLVTYTYLYYFPLSLSLSLTQRRKRTAVLVVLLENFAGRVPQIDVFKTVRPVFEQQWASLSIERIHCGVDGTADLQRSSEWPERPACVFHSHAEVLEERVLVDVGRTATKIRADHAGLHTVETATFNVRWVVFTRVLLLPPLFRCTQPKRSLCV